MAKAIQIRYASKAQDKQQQFSDWLQNYTITLDHRTTFTHIKVQPVGYKPDHYLARVYLSDKESLSTAVNELSEDVFAGISWYVLHTHDCTHDRSLESSDCSWGSSVRSRGNVPSVYL